MGITKDVMTETINGKRSKGWPIQRWIDIVKSILGRSVPGTKFKKWADRDRWNQTGSEWAIKAKKKKKNGVTVFKL